MTDKQTGKDYAAKVMSKRELVRMRKVEAAFAEKAMLTDLKHGGIVELFQTFQDPDNLCTPTKHLRLDDLLRLNRFYS